MKKKAGEKKAPSPGNKNAETLISKKSKSELVSEENSKTHSKPYPIVAIGASAGGMEAMINLLDHLSPTTGMAYVYIQHLDPKHESMLSNIFSKRTKMPVYEAEEKMRILPDHIYVIPPNKDIEIIDGVLTLDERPQRPGVHLPINRFFLSLAEKQKEGSIGIVLSGNASDGTLGLKAIKAAGGITFAQDSTAKFQSMPKSAITEGAVDLVLSPDQMAAELMRLSSKPDKLYAVISDKEEEQEKEPEEINMILQYLRKSTGVDFSNYKKNTIRRRIGRRMLIYKLDSLKDYHQYLKQHTNEISILLQDLLINVTAFFRDTEMMEYLKTNVLPQIIKNKSTDDPVRIWVPACSTGQESYSLAMLLIEVLGNKADSIPIQIFSTDLSEAAITKARSGLYSKTETAEVTPERLQRFFTKEDNHYRINKSIRDLCVFATHNVFKDPPFSRLDLVSCCNLLIYLDPLLQKKAIASFHYALNTDGYLILGNTESIGTATTLFAPLEKRLKIYQRKKDGHARATFEITGHQRERDIIPGRRAYYSNYENQNEPDIDKIVDSLLLSNYIPSCVVVNQDLDILQFRGSTSLFLEPSPGKASLNLLKMARHGLGFELRNAVHKAIKTDKPYRKENIEVKNKDSIIHINIEVAPVKSPDNQKHFLVLFEEEKVKEIPGKGKDKNLKAEQLEAELNAAREDMSAIIEEREAVNEELQSANEEIVSSNEELQSINEELETSKEEIESTNEELQTINQELTTRNEQLSEAFNFADAVFGTMREALLVLDSSLRILRANQSFYKLFLTSEDETEGRLIFDVGNGQWDIPRLRQLLQEIIPKDNRFYGFEVNHNFSGIGEKMMILNAHKIEQPALKQQMILLAIEDITDHVVAQRLLTEQALILRNVANYAPVMMWTSDTNGNRNFFNKKWLEFTGKTAEEEKAMGWLNNIHPDDRESLLKIYNEAFKLKEAYHAEYRLKRNDEEYRWVMSSANPSYDEKKSFAGYIGTVTDIHDQKMFAEELERQVEARTKDLEEVKSDLVRSNNELGQFAYVASHDLQEPLRKISSFSTQLQAKFKNDLPPTAADYVERMKISSQHMVKMVNDLLDFSHVNGISAPLTLVDLNGTLLRVLKDFDLLINEKKAEIKLEKMPAVKGVPIQMQQLFSNLISNALKFIKINTNPEIIISSRMLSVKEVSNYSQLDINNKYCEITVKDNGIGFQQADSELIFNIFQRLNSRKEYSGTGIGLALCKKIVEKHGGVIFAVSEIGKGAAFHVILPVD